MASAQSEEQVEAAPAELANSAMEEEDFKALVSSFVGHELNARLDLINISNEVVKRWPDEGNFIYYEGCKKSISLSMMMKSVIPVKVFA